MSKLIPVMSKTRKSHGVVCPGVVTEYSVEVTKTSIVIYKDIKGVMTKVNEFALGQTAEYDSFNLSYMGKIVSITDKTVTIAKSWGSQVKKHRLDLYSFCWRNWNFNAEKAAAENSAMSMYL